MPQRQQLKGFLSDKALVFEIFVGNGHSKKLNSELEILEAVKKNYKCVSLAENKKLV